jgi:hypothetical protein
VVLFLTLAYMAVACPPYGVVAMGAVMTGDHVVVVLPDVSSSALFTAVIMAAYTMLCTMASANSWAVQDRQVRLLRIHEALAATDALTGCHNRRAFLQRLDGAITAAARAGGPPAATGSPPCRPPSADRAGRGGSAWRRPRGSRINYAASRFAGSQRKSRRVSRAALNRPRTPGPRNEPDPLDGSQVFMVWPLTSRNMYRA